MISNHSSTMMIMFCRLVAQLLAWLVGWLVGWLGGKLLGETALLGNVNKKINDSARIAPLVVVPGDQLDKVGVQRDTGLGVKDARVGVANEIGGNNFVFGIGHDAFVSAF